MQRQELYCEAERNWGSMFTRCSRCRSKNSVVPQFQPCRRMQGLSCRIVAHKNFSALWLNLEGWCQCMRDLLSSRQVIQESLPSSAATSSAQTFPLEDLPSRNGGGGNT